MTKVLVLGGSGMIGRAIVSELVKKKIQVVFTGRSNQPKTNQESAQYQKFDLATDDLSGLFESIGGLDYVINCLGIVKSKITESNKDSTLSALKANSLFPYQLEQQARQRGFKVIQLATDCVFSGKTGAYSETSLHDAEDVYGKTKSLGEVSSDLVMNLRVSVIGPGEQGLLHWVVSQPQNSQITGYTNHLWNGITSQAYGQIIAGLIAENLFQAGVHHLIPSDSVTKSQLVSQLTTQFRRTDIQIHSAPAPKPIDRTLATNNSALNLALWQAAGYSAAPTIQHLTSQILHAAQ